MESPSSKRLVRPAEIEAEVQAANRRFVRYQSAVAATSMNGVPRTRSGDELGRAAPGFIALT
jgi:hypothetical protein